MRTAYDFCEIIDTTIVHESVFAKDEWMIVNFDNGWKASISDMGQGAFGCRMCAKLAKRKIGRNRGNSPELGGLHAFDGGVEFCECVSVPSYSEAVDINPRRL